MKYPHSVLRPDANFPGLQVCDTGCADQFDPYRLPARKTERITIRFPRPDVNLDGTGDYMITTGNNQYYISIQGSNETPANNGNENTIEPSPPG
jgi:hypothetical protein